MPVVIITKSKRKYDLGDQVKSVYFSSLYLWDYIYLKAWDISIPAIIKVH